MYNVKKLRERAMKLLDYDKETGIFTWKSDIKGRMKGRVAGTVISSGYRQISIDNKRYLASRLAWLFVYGQWPVHNIDHINGDKTDNRIVNLRDVTQRENTLNRSEHRNGKLVGVTKRKSRTNPWQARITRNGKNKYLGCFATEIEAHNAYMEAYLEAAS